ncbi:MAG: hypothetical protein JKY53_13690 [Flavobacteriales bacterium]|nr:hypothetical protein [Flavobacteriales bacterium]
MKKNLLLLTLLLPAYLMAQVNTSKEFKLEVREPYTVVDGTQKFYFTHEDQMMAIKIRGDVNFQLFDANSLEEIKKAKISKKEDLPRGFVHEEFLQQGDKVIEFYNVWDKPNKTEQIFCKTFSFSDLGKAEDDKLLFKTGKLKSQMGQNKIDLCQSFDEGITLVVYEEYSTEKKDALNFQVYGVVAYDKDMNELWKKDIKMPYSEAEFENLGFTVDSKGNAYLLLRKKSDEDKNGLEIMKITADSDPEIIKIEAEGKYFPRGIKIQEGKNGKLYLAGYYGGRIAVEGVYVSVLGSGGIESEKFNQIPLDVINQYRSEKSQEKTKAKAAEGEPVGIDHLNLDEIVINEDGSLILVGEVFFVFTIPGVSQATNKYNYREVVLSKINSDGELLWIKKLIKNQKRTAQYSGSYGSCNTIAYANANKEPRFDLSYNTSIMEIIITCYF